MNATIALQEALVAQLSPIAQLTGIYNDAPARAAFPYVVVNCNDESNWSFKGRIGREVTVHLTIWDQQPSRLLELEAEMERQLRPVFVNSDWRLSSIVLTGKRRTREPSGPWSCMLAHRARLIASAGEVTE